ncbi:MAG: DUF4328 domain-containing protein [Pyrinomonadaceae bacterium]
METYQPNYSLTADTVLPSSAFASGRLRAQLAVVMLGVMVAVDLVSVVVNSAFAGQLMGFADQSAVYELGDDVSVSEILIAIFGLLYLLVFILTVVAFLMWLHRAYRNLRALTTAPLEASPGWAVGYWFIPFVNLVRPYQIVKETWSRSDPARDTSGTFLSSEPMRSTSLLGVWWGFWLPYNILGNISGRLTWRAETVGDYLTATWFDIASSVFGIVAGACAILVVRQINEMQETKARRHVPVGPPPPPASFTEPAL